MRSSRLILAPLILSSSLFLACCTHLGNPALEDVNNFMALKKGIDTKETVFAKFGQPADVVYSKDAGASSTWVYVKSDIHPNGWSYVPYGNLGWRVNSRHYEGVFLVR